MPTARRALLAVLAVTAAGAAAALGASGQSEGSPAAPSAPVPAQPSTTANVPQDRVEHATRDVRRGGEAREAEPRGSRALGTPEDGRLVRGVRLPAEGPRHFTWDPIRGRSPNRGWRRNGHDRLVAVLMRALEDYAERNPSAPRVGIGDLSRPRGGDFGARYGIVGHVSHQNGLDADLYYPRADRRERPALVPADMDPGLAQRLVDALVRAGASEILVGPGTGLRGRRGVVRTAAGHDHHLHVRVSPGAS